VRLVGDLHNSPFLPVVENTVALQISGVPTEFGARYYIADWFDDPFRESYPTDMWLSGQILQFKWVGRGAFPRRILTLRNDARQDLSALLIGAGDRFVILDIKSGSTLQLAVVGGGDTHIEGIFVDGTRPEKKVFSFADPPPQTIIVTDAGIRAHDES
jgi:hypothetical protein